VQHIVEGVSLLIEQDKHLSPLHLISSYGQELS
jgi:hypothetical protein